MIPINVQDKKKKISSCFLMQCFIWAAAACTMILVYYKKSIPIYTQELLNSIHSIKSPELKPGDSLSQSFRSTYDKLYSVEIAFSYKNNIPEDASVLIEVLLDENPVLEQPLSVRYCPESTFCTLITELEDCLGKSVTIRVSNTSPSSSDKAVFSLLSTEKDYLYLDNTDNYFLNGEEQEARLLCRFTYLTGYSHYQALTCSCWIFIVALIISGLIPRFYRRGL